MQRPLLGIPAGLPALHILGVIYVLRTHWSINGCIYTFWGFPSIVLYTFCAQISQKLAVSTHMSAPSRTKSSSINQLSSQNNMTLAFSHCITPPTLWPFAASYRPPHHPPWQCRCGAAAQPGQFRQDQNTQQTPCWHIWQHLDSEDEHSWGVLQVKSIQASDVQRQVCYIVHLYESLKADLG